MKTLIIVESPNKAKAVARYAREVLPGTVTARACLGYLRDLPKGRLGVDVKNGFRPDYQVMPNRCGGYFTRPFKILTSGSA